MFKRNGHWIAILGLWLLASSATAGVIQATGALTSKPDGSNFDDSITLSNSSASTDSIGTFWFAWIPGKDFLPSNPFNLSAPAGWTASVTNLGAGDGFAVQYVASSPSASLAPGSSLSGFSFSTADSPGVLAGNSPFGTTFPVTTSFVYQGAPLVGDSAQFSIPVTALAAPSSSSGSTSSSSSPSSSSPVNADTTVPEPSSLGIFGAIASALYLRARLRRKPHPRARGAGIA